MEKNIRSPQHEILVGKNKWISKQEWQRAIRARKNGTATDEQKEYLEDMLRYEENEFDFEETEEVFRLFAAFLERAAEHDVTICMERS